MSDQPEPIDERALPGATDAHAVDASFRNDLLAAWLDDVDAGRTRSLAEYQTMFPEHASKVEAELRALEEEVSDPEAIPAAKLIDIPDVQLIETIGRGGQGVVYRGRQSYLERDVAVKVLAPTHWSETFASRFRREATSLASLRHANIVSCYQAGTTDEGLAYIVMEFIDGPNLGEWLRDHGPMEESVALRLCRDLSLALEQAQRSNIIHRDVKPENVLLQSTPEDESMPFTPKLADLGLARVTADTREDANLTKLTPFGVVMGSPSTMAPEQFDYADRVDHRADIYGLGCILYHALAGEPAFHVRAITAVIKAKISSGAPDVRKLNPEVRPEVAAFVQSLMAPAADDRPATHGEVAATCSRLLGGTDRATRHGPRWLVGIAAVALLTAMLFTQPWSSDDRLSVEIAAPRRVNEGQLVEMQAVALGDGDLRYTWRQTEGPKVRLSGIGTANASFRAPRGIADSDLGFSVTVTHGQNSNNDIVHVAVQPSKDHKRLERGSVHRLFKPGLGKTVEDWFGKTGPGTWGTADDDSGATGFCSKGSTQRSHYLPRGNWELAGALQGIERWTEDGTGNFKRAGLRLEFSCGNSIELALQQATGGETTPSGTYHPRLRRIPHDADPIELGSENQGSIELEQILQFKLTWNHGSLTAAWKQSPGTRTWTEVRIDPSTWPSPYPPSTLTIFVDRGHACFRDLALTGL